MSNLHLEFTNPWLLLLLIPAIALPIISYFRLNKRYRFTRNRVASVSLHILIMVLSISVLAGLTLNYSVPNDKNEVILLVDVSDSNELSEVQKDQFIESVLNVADKSVKVGIVTFGYGANYAVELTNDVDSIFNEYLDAPRPDDTATNIADALVFAKEKFSENSSGKIVLISDGLETDNSARAVISSLAIEGIRVDTMQYANEYSINEIQLIDAQFPDYSLVENEAFNINLVAKSKTAGTGMLSVYDNGELVGEAKNVTFTATENQIFTISHTFESAGLHELKFELVSSNDTEERNNVYYTYYNLQSFDKILILKSSASGADALNGILQTAYTTTVKNIDEAPDTLDELREYDQVILMNIARSDMNEGFEDILYEYVHDIGGGLLTTGGTEIDEYGDVVSHAYNKDDMFGSVYQDILPVSAIDYTPPIAVMVLLDISGSMSGCLDEAIQGVISVAEALGERDYIGILTLESSVAQVNDIIPATQKSKLYAKLEELKATGGTNFVPAIEAAGSYLAAFSLVEKKHMIIVSDGQPSEPADEFCEKAAYYYDNAGVTLSVVTIEGNSDALAEMDQLAASAGGKNYDVRNTQDIPKIMREDILAPEIRGVTEEEFVPEIAKSCAAVTGVSQEDMPSVYGFNGTKAKSNDYVILSGEYVPIYAQWNYGAGRVGSFMIDLEGSDWSAEFMSSTAGLRFIDNVVKGIFPSNDIKATEIDLELQQENYTVKASVFTDIQEGDTVEIIVKSPNPANPNDLADTIDTVYPLSASDGFSRLSFAIKQGGVHTIIVNKKDSAGNIIATYQTHYSFSYSLEYDMFANQEDADIVMNDLAEITDGVVMTTNSNANAVFEGFITTFDKNIDPRLAFIILALICFLLDIAVRKFKFKWPHELIREYRESKQK